MLPRISIITTSYNQGRFIENTIRSVIDQDYENLEYVIVDGGSIDGTKEILKRYRHDGRIAKIISEKDRGQTDALLKAFAIISGDVVGWINSDDLLAPEALSVVGEFFARHTDVDVLVGNLLVIDKDGKKVALWPRRKMTNSDWMKSPQAIGQPATFFRRSAYDGVGGLNPKWEYAMDYDLFMRFGIKGYKFYYLDEIFAHFRLHDASKTIALPYKSWKEEFKVYRENGGGILSAFYYWKFRGIVSTVLRGKILGNRKW